MVFPQKVNWFILYRLADKMATIFLGLAHAPIFLEVWLGVNGSVKGIYGNSSAFGGCGKIGAGLNFFEIATSAFGLLAMTRK